MRQISNSETPVLCFSQSSITESIIATHPNPRTVDIMAMTPNILDSQKDALCSALEKGARVNFLLTNGTAALIWNQNQKSFAEKLNAMQTFQIELVKTSCRLVVISLLQKSLTGLHR